MLITDYDLEVFTPRCQPSSERLSAIARLVVDISPTLPYLNATLEGACYHPSAQALTCTRDGCYITFCAYYIGIEYVEDREDAQRLAEELIDLVNHTWEQREHLTPSHEVRERPQLMTVYKLLPQTNCKACGQPTCFVFALNLIVGQAQLGDCPLLREPDYAERNARLHELL